MQTIFQLIIKIVCNCLIMKEKKYNPPHKNLRKNRQITAP